MAWTLHYQCCFQSRTGNQYAVNIYEQDYSGSVVQLTGAENPFTTRENDADDIFTPVRGQTGYLRIIDDGTLMEQIIPTNNTQRMVKLYSGSYTGTWPSGTFYEYTLQWQGFMCAEAFTQPWDGNKNVVEFPVASMLETLKVVQMPTTIALNKVRMVNLLHYGLGPSGMNVWNTSFGSVTVCSDENSNTLWLNRYVDLNVFYEWTSIQNQGQSVDVLQGITVYDALSAVLALFGLTAREKGDELYFFQYDNGDECVRWRWTWANIDAMVSGTKKTGSSTGVLPTSTLLSSFTFKGKDNTATYLLGANNVKVKFSFDTEAVRLAQLPLSDETTTVPSPISSVKNGTLYIVPQQPRNISTEEYHFYKYGLTRTTDEHGQVTGTWYQYNAESSYSECLSLCIIGRPTPPDRATATYPYSNEYDYRVNGAFPCRWFFKQDDELVVLNSGLFLSLLPSWLYNSQSTVPGMAYIPRGIIGDGYYPFYTIKSANSIHLEEGIYLNIQMHLMPILIAYSSMPIFMDGSNIDGPMNEVDINSDKEYSIVVTIYCGDTELGEREISFKNNKIQTNWSSPVGTVEDEGYFIRINNSIDGVLILRLNRVVSYDKDGNWSTGQVGYAIIDNIVVTRCYPTSMSASDRNENTYYKDILMSGFENKKTIDLTVGTFNNNRSSVAFICDEDDSNTNIQELAYNEDGQSEVYDERPEMHLLDRMESIYSSVRRTFKAIVATGNDIFKKRYANSGRNYVGIDAQHNWREETQYVKFIEVT